MMLGTDAGAQYGAMAKLRKIPAFHDQALHVAISSPIDSLQLPAWPAWLSHGRVVRAESETSRSSSRRIH